MAKTITDEEIKLSIIINGNPAQKQLLDLEKATRKLTEEKKNLQLELKRVETSLGKDSAEYKKLAAQIKLTTTTIDNNKAAMKELQNQIGITGLTIGQLREKANFLKITLRNLIPDSDDFKKYDAELKQVNTRLSELSGKAKESRYSLSSLADGFNKYAALAASVVAGLTGVVFSIQKVIDMNGKLSDAQADVMKTTGMNKKEVDELTKSFGLLETRTSRIDLLKIAEQGGRLGIPKAEIQDFVKTMNMAAVSLGDSFTGGVDEVAEKLGKIKFLFKETQNMNVEQAYNSIGSAINDLGANGTASEANIAEFTKRIGSLTDVLKPTVQETLALGTAFEESGIEAETSSRAYNIFMKQASTESSKFAKVMGLSKKAVEDMINTNPMNFMLDFAKGMRGMDATQTAKTLDYLGINADGANKVIGAMGNNFERFHELIDLSNNSFAKGSSLINEYNIKNETLGATLEKISKKVSGWFSSETFIKWLGNAVQMIAKFIGAAEDVDGSVSKWKNSLIALIKIITVAIVGFTSYSAALKLIAIYENGLTGATTLLTIAQKANALSGGTLKALYLGLQYVFYTLTLQEDKATASMIRFNLATKMNPIGLIVGLIMAAAAAYVVFNKEIDKASIYQKNLNDVRKIANENTVEEKNTLESYLMIARDRNQSDEVRENAIKKINELSPEYLGNIKLETINTAEATTAINNYLAAMDKKAMKEAFASKRVELSKGVIDAKNNKDLSEYGTSWYNSASAKTEFKTYYELESSNIEKFKKLTNGWNSYKLGAYRDYKNAILDAEDQLKALSEEEKKFISKNAKVYVDTNSNGKSTYTVPGEEDKAKAKNNPNSSQEEINRLRVENDSKYNDILLKNRRQLEDDKISAMQDGYEKELAIENLRFQREVEDFQRQKVHVEEMAKLDEEISKAKKDGDLTLYNSLLVIKKSWGDRNKILDEQINQIIEGKRSIHFYKLATIEEKAAKDEINKTKQKFEADKVLRETKFQEQLAALGNNKLAKEKLKKEFEASELVEQEKFLKELIDKFNIIVGKGKLENIDLSLLTPQQVEEFTAEAAKVGLSLAELIAKRNELVGKSDVSNALALGLNKGNTDILGFTQDNWKQFYDNLQAGKFGVDEMIFAVSALTDMYAKYSSFVSANENRQLQQFERSSDKKKIRLKRQLDTGYINQSQYDKQIKKIDDEVDKRKAELAYKQAKREKAIAIMSAITGTATAVIGALGNKPWTPFNFALAGIVGAMGALNIATIATTPLPAKGYEQGLYPVKREQDGKIFQSRFGGKTRSGLVNKPTYFLTGENGPEMIIDSRAYSKIHPQVKDALWNELNGIKGWEQGKYNKTTQRFEVPASSTSPSASNNNDEALRMNAVVMAEVLEVLKDLRDNPIQALVDKNDKKSMKNIKQGVDDYNDFRNKNKY